MCRRTELHGGISWFDFWREKNTFWIIAAKTFFDLSVTMSMSFSIRQAVSSVLRECCQRDGCGTLSLPGWWCFTEIQLKIQGTFFMLFESCCVSLVIYDKMGKIVLDDIRDKFKRPEEARLQVWGFDVFFVSPSRFGPRRSQKSPSKTQVQNTKRLRWEQHFSERH